MAFLLRGLTLVGVLSLALGTAAALGDAGKYNVKVKIGDPAADFHDLPGVDGKKHALADFAHKSVLVLAFISNHCPISRGYEDRLIAFAKKHTQDVAVVAVNVNLLDGDKLPQMAERARQVGIPFPYLFDESQELGRRLGATLTPEFFVFGKDRKLVYMGAFDNHDDASKATENYLEQAVSAALAGRVPVAAETRPRGCSVIYEKNH